MKIFLHFCSDMVWHSFYKVLCCGSIEIKLFRLQIRDYFVFQVTVTGNRGYANGKWSDSSLFVTGKPFTYSRKALSAIIYTALLNKRMRDAGSPPPLIIFERLKYLNLSKIKVIKDFAKF